MKMPTSVGIFIFISGENFILSWLDNENSFITSGLDFALRLVDSQASIGPKGGWQSEDAMFRSLVVIV